MASDSNPLAYILLQVFLVTFSLFSDKKHHDEASIRKEQWSQLVIICLKPSVKEFLLIYRSVSQTERQQLLLSQYDLPLARKELFSTKKNNT
jgi:hypothetical protein